MRSVKQVTGRIVVGVDSSTASRQAVLWAAAEARIRHGDLVITHVQPAVPTAGATQVDADLDRHLMLAASATAASTRQPGVAVGTLLIAGDISDELVRLSRSAAMLVVGLDRTVSRAAHGATGPVEDRVVAHAWCPVVIVSEQRPAHEVPLGLIVVGLTAGSESLDALEAAAAEAAVRHAALCVLIGRTDWSAGDSLGTNTTEGSAVRHAIEELSQTYPQLTVTWEDVADRLRHELEQASRTADLLVVGCEKSEERWSIRIGALSSEMTREAHCPVMLIRHRLERPALTLPAA